jgi:hypothetical protein
MRSRAAFHSRTSLWSSRSLFPRKSDFRGQRQNGHNVGGGTCEKSRDKVDPAEGANTGYLAPLPGNLCGAVSDWWSNEDLNHGPGRFYRRRATGSLRDRGRSDTNTVFPGTAALDTGVACRISRRAVRCEVSRCSREHGRRRRTPRRYIAGSRWAD